MREQRNIVPVTIRQLQQAIAISPAEAATKDQPFQIDGRDCHVRENLNLTSLQLQAPSLAAFQDCGCHCGCNSSNNTHSADAGG